MMVQAEQTKRACVAALQEIGRQASLRGGGLLRTGQLKDPRYINLSGWINLEKIIESALAET